MGLSVASLVVWLLCLVQMTQADENGIIGFGISLYQDLCCQACHDSLSMLYLNCTTFSDGMGGDGMSGTGTDTTTMGMTSDECHASNTPWLQTMAYCIQQNCNADGYGAENQARCFSNQAVAGATSPTFQESLPATAPTEELAADAMWLNVTSLVNRDTYYATHGTLGEFARQEYMHARFSVILYLIVVGTCIACGILAHTRSIFPGIQKQISASTLWTKLQQHLFLPALVGSRRLEPLPGNAGYIPGRTLSVFIAIFVILNVIFCSISFRNFSPNIWFPSPQFELCEYVGNRTGTLSLVNISIAILFAGRNNLLIAITGWSQTTFLTLHRWAARVATVQAVVHSIVYTLGYFEPGHSGAADYAAEVAMPFYWWGIVATVAICFVVIFAILPIRARFYELFLITHIALVILTLVACWYHLVPHFGFVYGYQVWLYIAFAFWAADRIIRFARVIYYNRFGCTAAMAEAIPGSNVMEVTVYPRFGAHWNFGPGQHSFLYFPGLGKPWENHPFSIAGWTIRGEPVPTASSSDSPVNSSEDRKGDSAIVPPMEDMEIKEEKLPVTAAATERGADQQQTKIQAYTAIRFLIRVHSGLTSTLQRSLLSTPSGCNMDLSVYIEGPYGGHRATLQPLLVADTVVCIIGGIGITNALGFIQEYARVNSRRGESLGNSRGAMGRAKRFILAWSARELALIEHVRRSFLATYGDVDGIEYRFWMTAPPDTATQKAEIPCDEGSRWEIGAPGNTADVTLGRMNIGAVMRSVLETGLHTTVLACGPGSMTDEATREVVNCVRDGFRVDLVEESFAW